MASSPDDDRGRRVVKLKLSKSKLKALEERSVDPDTMEGVENAEPTENDRLLVKLKLSPSKLKALEERSVDPDTMEGVENAEPTENDRLVVKLKLSPSKLKALEERSVDPDDMEGVENAEPMGSGRRVVKLKLSPSKLKALEERSVDPDDMEGVENAEPAGSGRRVVKLKLSPSKLKALEERSVDPDTMEGVENAESTGSGRRVLKLKLPKSKLKELMERSVDPDAMEEAQNAESTATLRDQMSAMGIQSSAPASRYGFRNRSSRKRYFEEDRDESESPPTTTKGKKRKTKESDSSTGASERKWSSEHSGSSADWAEPASSWLRVKKHRQKERSKHRVKAEPSDKEVTIAAKAGDCHFEPPAWATCKAEILNTFGKHWYNAPYRITHSYKDEYGVVGYFMHEHSGCRYIDEEVLIVGINGGFQKDAKGKWTLKRNQTRENTEVNIWAKNRDNDRPIGVIVGDKCEAMQRKLSHCLNIMDFFMVTDIWEEMQNGHNRFTVRLQKLDLKKKSWWAKAGTPNPPVERDFPPLEKRTCTGSRGKGRPCNKSSPQIYKVGWMCLARSCSQFWRINGELADSAENLEFDERFLSWRQDFNVQECLDKAWYPLIPKIDISKDDSHTRRDGIICPDCNRCIPRVYMGNWQCQLTWPRMGGVERQRAHEAGCKWAHDLPPKVTQLNDKQLRAIKTAYAHAKKPGQTTGYAKQQRELKDVFGNSMGRITHFISNKSINAKPNGPDELFELLQTTSKALGLRRLRGSAPKVTGMMSNNFLKNVGIPYDFQVPMATQSFKEFDKQNPGVMHAFARLDWAFQDVSKDDPYEYTKANELLFIGYQQGQELKWHNDGSGKLGPQIATFCLGSECTMMFRMKADYYFGLDKHGKPLQPEDTVLEGCKDQDWRKEMLEKYKSKAIDKAQYDRERLLRLERSTKGQAKVMKPYITLRHGDISVMNGENIQKYYEHCVESIPGMRYAITARHVKPDCRSVRKRMAKEKMRYSIGKYKIKPEELFDGTK